MNCYLNPNGLAAIAAATKESREALDAKRAERLQRYSKIAIETANAATDALEHRDTFQIGTLRLSSAAVANHFSGGAS
jgi:ribosomal protein L9